MKRFMWAVLAFSLLAMTTHGQNTPAADLAGGYSYLHLNGSGGASGANLNGFSASVGVNVNNWLGIVGDFGVYHGSPSGVGLTGETFTFGPRISFRQSDKFVPFVQALFGGSHFSASAGGVTASTTPFAFGFGGGVDVGIGGSGKWAVRPQFDYIGMRSNGSTQNSERVSIGLVYHIGQK
jgi:hypothetical protein